MYRLKNLRWDHYLIIFCLAFIVLTLPFFGHKKQEILDTKTEYDLIQIGMTPVLKDELKLGSKELLDRLSAQNVLAIDVDTATVLIEKNSTQSAFPASTTKMMTAMVALQNYQLTDVLTVQRSDLINGNRAGFVVGEQIRAGDLIHALLIGSNNEAASILARGIDGGEQAFVDQMNKLARDINLSSTLFVNPAGFDNENIYSSARDLAVLARELIEDPYLKEVVAKKEFWFESVDAKYSHLIGNTNELLFEDQTVKGLKTGTTEGAGEVLVTLIERDGHQVVTVVMGSNDRYADTKAIVNWIYSSYEWIEIDLLAL